MRYLTASLFFFSALANSAVFKLPSGILPDKTFVTVEAAAQAYISFSGFGSCRIDTYGFTKYEIGEIYQTSFDVVITNWLDKNCEVFSRKSILPLALVVLDECPDGSQPNPNTGLCEEKPQCKELEGEDAPQPPMLPPENGQPITATRLYCDTGKMCEAARIYYNDQDALTRSFVYTGHECVGSESDYANNPWYGSHTDPDTPDPDQPLPDPEHKPDIPTGDIEDPSVLPDDSTGQVPVDPDPVEPEPDVPTPDPTPDSNGDVVQAVTNLNRDVNKTITSLNVDINASNARLESELKGVNAKITDNTQAIVDLHKATKQAADNEKALLLGLNKDVTTAVNQVRNETASGLFGVKDAVNKLGDDLENLLSGNGRGFNTPSGSGDWDGNGKDGTLIGDSIDGIKGEIEVLEQDLKNLLQKSPINMGQMNFQQGSYTPESFVLKGQEVSFNLFGILKADKNLIQSVIIFLAFLTAAFIILSSGRSR
ncbi:hypothetical protein VV99796_00793 [Vibrio vulnificus]|uniref:hypothetical protein n=1 Tax=Vibrio vulnificus TaxID=672 RepID=UPI00092CD8A5|nr:hypothetical protein [Vibrio vulnificus]EHT4941892.1 hypothetical protein [Vibrio vulnificus]OJI30301.1 hypothetical protein VV99796_00793 [Vibrio vulnificus]OJI51718.1 hypothetical protein VVS316_00711 [Vibrio vulnificus]POB08618.1 hypothetical protein CRN33_02780 [Vibrio vulnificus]